MTIIRQGRPFDWEDVENLGELKRLDPLLETVPDEPLMRLLKAERGRGRRNLDADFGKKTYREREEDSTLWERRAGG